jgi:hypothetical protein
MEVDFGVDQGCGQMPMPQDICHSFEWMAIGHHSGRQGAAEGVGAFAGRLDASSTDVFAHDRR